MSVHKGQSALEYLTTYGWVILIITIVAVLLYVFGTSPPTNSFPTTINGFTDLGTPSAICWSNGTLSLLLGNSVGGTVIEIQQMNVTLSNSSIKSFTFSRLIAPGGSTTFALAGVCPSTTGKSYSLNVKVKYIEPYGVLRGPYFSYGLIQGAAAASP